MLIDQKISLQMSTQQILSFILSDLTISDIRILRDIANKRKDITESSFSYLQMYFDEVKNDDLLILKLFTQNKY